MEWAAKERAPIIRNTKGVIGVLFIRRVNLLQKVLLMALPRFFFVVTMHCPASKYPQLLRVLEEMYN